MDYRNNAVKCAEGIERNKKVSRIMTCLLIISLLLYLTACSTSGSKTLFQTSKSTEAASEVFSASDLFNIDATELGTAELADEEITKEIDLNEFILPESDRRIYSREELSRLSTADLRLARNEIYARRGRIFIENDLQIYFDSKSWYNSQYTPGDFEQNYDTIFNEFELANCKLIVSMEQGADRLDSNSAYISLNAGYTDIVNENQHKRRLKLTVESMFNNAENCSKIIDRGSYYEVTHGCIEAETSYDLSVMNGKRVGDTLQLGNSLYRIEEIRSWVPEGGEDVELKYVSGPEEEILRLGRQYGENYYTPLFKDSAIAIDHLYTGSLYFGKDCIITVNDPSNQYRSHTVTIEDFFSQDREIVGAEFGFHTSLYSDIHSGCLSLWGGFEIDASGLIISYTESFLS